MDASQVLAALQSLDAAQIIGLVQMIPGAGPLLVWLPLVATICSIADALIPQPKVGSAWVLPRKAVAILALSILHARNATPAGAPPVAIGLAKVAEQVTALEPTRAVSVAAEVIEGATVDAEAKVQAITTQLGNPVPQTLSTQAAIALALLACALAACSPPAALPAPAAAVAAPAGPQPLFCGIATRSGPLVVALISSASPSSAAVAVTTAAAVQAACAQAGGIPVSPPPPLVVVPRVAVPGPVDVVHS